jgi:hypothetical protein
MTFLFWRFIAFMIRYVVKCVEELTLGTLYCCMYNDNKMLIIVFHLCYFCQDYRNVD